MNNHKAALNNTAPHFDDDELLTKLDGLLNKNKNQGKPAINAKFPASEFTRPDVILEHLAETVSDRIPTLRETVMLHSMVQQSQIEHSTSLRQVLDAALDEAKIDMNAADRGALTRVLEKHLVRSLSD